VERAKPASEEADALQLQEVMHLLRTGREADVVLGKLARETPSECWKTVEEALPRLSGVVYKNCGENVSRLLERKTDREVRLTAGASSFACELMKVFRDRMEDIVDEGRQVTHSEVDDQMEGILKDEKEMGRICSKLALTESGFDISRATSSASWNPHSDVDLDNGFVAESGTIILNLFARCCSGHLRPRSLKDGYEPSTSGCAYSKLER
jgi:nucleosome binding factor SPN SPT16 subunit